MNTNETIRQNSNENARKKTNGQIKLITITEINAKNFERYVLNSNKVSC